MPTEATPRIGDWYKNHTGDAFEIVAQDDDDDTLELQYYDGTVEELDTETWKYMHPEPIEPPEDWRGSMDLEADDNRIPDSLMEPDNWLHQLDRMDGKTS